ncbi:MAG: esterase family protein [Ignavibacteriales bacterium]|nr:MAG: esterase family protein [Ignavibacteriales bacterium]
MNNEIENLTEKKNHLNMVEGLSSTLENWNNLSKKEKEILKQNILDSLDKQDYPFYESDSKVTLIYKGIFSKVEFISDITGWTDTIPFKKLEGVDLFFLSLELEPKARIEYQLIIKDKYLCDPSNKFKSLNGLGALSELVMPKYERHPYFQDYLFGKVGSYDGLIKHNLPAGALPYNHEVYVYLPPDYNQNKRYPTVYFQDGPDYIRFALAPYSINRLILERKIDSCIAVFVTPPNLHQPKVPNRSTEYGMNDDYVKFFCDELVKFIDENYSTIQSPDKRLVVGDSYAGLISTYISFIRNELFRNAYSQSGYYSFNDDSIIKLFNESEKKSVNLYFDIGTYENKVGADFLPATELDFINANRRMNEVLKKKGYNFIYKEYFEGHTWGNWRKHLIDAMIYFFGNKGEMK